MDPLTLAVSATIVVAMLVAALAVLALRSVPAGRTGVVLRAGRPSRVVGPGLTWLVPGIETIASVPAQPFGVDPVAAVGTTRDGVEVRLVTSLLVTVTDPHRAATVDPALAVVDTVERVIAAAVAGEVLSDLLAKRDQVVAVLLAGSEPLLHQVGLELLDVQLVDVEVRMGPQLLRLLG